LEVGTGANPVAAKLGEILVRNGSITEQQLDAALKSQLIWAATGHQPHRAWIRRGRSPSGWSFHGVYGVPTLRLILFAKISDATIQAIPAKDRRGVRRPSRST
jgi:hypothetical protein